MFSFQAAFVGAPAALALALALTLAFAPALATLIVGALSVYIATTGVYRLFFHPLAKFPGPRLAAVSPIWRYYHCLSGRYAFAIEDALRKYGDVVRIAPNELVFMNHQAFIDIYGAQHNGRETFLKTSTAWGRDLLGHTSIADKLLVKFRGALTNYELIIRTQAEAILDYIYARSRYEEPETVLPLLEFINWFAMDVALNLTYYDDPCLHDIVHLSPKFDLAHAWNALVPIFQMFGRIPLLRSLLSLVPALLEKLGSFGFFVGEATAGSLQWLARRPKLFRLVQTIMAKGYWSSFVLVPAVDIEGERRVLGVERQISTDRVASAGAQLVLASFNPMVDWLYFTMVHLLQNPVWCTLLEEEIRSNFPPESSMEFGAQLEGLPILHACLLESLRLVAGYINGLPRISPGAVIDGYFVPKGVIVQTSVFALARNPRYFNEPLQYRPERWLGPYDAVSGSLRPWRKTAFTGDGGIWLPHFSTGLRDCMGEGVAWMQAKLFVANIIRQMNISLPEGQAAPDLERLSHYGSWVKPEIMVDFDRVPQDGDSEGW
ncbi:cytochrome P450 [Lasiosphaeria ovina]|uniref:Cytochrome P450 n=1 Tax=Lasiosphaeria ovina TaxID=92902 RepID=A0AAE0N9X7_9PEZI|nr:cytochrome P450 [Lasiosphaeria ovina]